MLFNQKSQFEEAKIQYVQNCSFSVGSWRKLLAGSDSAFFRASRQRGWGGGSTAAVQTVRREPRKKSICVMWLWEEDDKRQSSGSKMDEGG